jgi:hypothetical protein
MQNHPYSSRILLLSTFFLGGLRQTPVKQLTFAVREAPSSPTAVPTVACSCITWPVGCPSTSGPWQPTAAANHTREPGQQGDIMAMAVIDHDINIIHTYTIIYIHNTVYMYLYYLMSTYHIIYFYIYIYYNIISIDDICEFGCHVKSQTLCISSCPLS